MVLTVAAPPALMVPLPVAVMPMPEVVVTLAMPPTPILAPAAADIPAPEVVATSALPTTTILLPVPRLPEALKPAPLPVELAFTLLPNSTKEDPVAPANKEPAV